LADRGEIHDLVMRYARGVDTRDMELVRSCFAEDCDVSRWGPGLADREAMIDYIGGVGHFHTTMHMMANQFVEVHGDRGQVDSYAMLTHHRDDRAGVTHQFNVSGGRYVERVERRDGRWVITARGGDPVWAPTGVTGATTGDGAVQWLLDRAEIHDVLMQYALGVDLRDYDRVAGCFASGFHAAYGDREFDDVGALVEFIRGVEHFASTTHALGSPLIEVAGSEAWAVTASLVTHRPREDEPDAEWVAAGRYVDHFVRDAVRWRIAERGPSATAGMPGVIAAPRTGAPRIEALLDRAHVHDAVVRSAIDREDGSGGHTHTFVNNQLVALDGDRATAETYLYAMDRAEPGARPSRWSDGPRRWVDELERDEAGWRVVSRDELTNRVADELVLGGRS
jgi:hypothetical protein